MVFICIILTAILLVLGIFLFRLRKRLREIGEAIQERRLWLQDERLFGDQWMGLGGLQANVNQLLTDSERQQKSGQDSLEQIRMTLGSIREAVFIIDPGNRVVMSNEAFENLLGLKERPLGRRLESIVQSSAFFDYVRETQSGKQSGFFVLEVLVKNESRWFEITGSSLPSRSDHPGVLTLFVLHDITKQTHLERVRTEFVQNLSHELRTPVTIISGFADTLVEDHDALSSEERGKFLEKIKKNSVRLTQMLEELLTLSRLENNPGALQFSLDSFHKIVTDTVEMFRLRLASGQALTMHLAEGNDRLMLDSMRMAQVLENLLENALRHARGFTTLEVVTEISSTRLLCRVRDNGPGIPAKDLPRIFERFYRVDKGRSRESGGTGLGLSIVKHIVQQHGGTVSVMSRVGEGTEIIFEIPYPEILAEKTVMNVGSHENAAKSAILPARGLS